MQDTLVKPTVLKGGEFLIKDAAPGETFIPEEINEEQQMIADMVRDFLTDEIVPNIDRI